MEIQERAPGKQQCLWRGVGAGTRSPCRTWACPPHPQAAASVLGHGRNTL